MLKCCPSLSRLPESAIIRPYRTGIPTDSSRLITAMAVAQDSHLYFPVYGNCSVFIILPEITSVVYTNFF